MRTLVHEIPGVEDLSQQRLKSLTKSDVLEAISPCGNVMTKGAIGYFRSALGLNPFDKAAAVVPDQAITAAPGDHRFSVSGWHLDSFQMRAITFALPMLSGLAMISHQLYQQGHSVVAAEQAFSELRHPLFLEKYPA